MQIISAYFLWVFVWLNVVSISDSTNEKVSKYFEARLKTEYNIANEMDNDRSNGDGGHWEPELDPWWDYYFGVKTVTESRQKVFTKLTSATTIFAIYAIEYFPPFIAGICAVFFPTQTHEWIFSVIGGAPDIPTVWLKPHNGI